MCTYMKWKFTIYNFIKTRSLHSKIHINLNMHTVSETTLLYFIFGRDRERKKEREREREKLNPRTMWESNLLFLSFPQMTYIAFTYKCMPSVLPSYNFVQ